MREILFRGKLKVDNGEHKKGDWVFGDLVRIKDGEKTSTMITVFNPHFTDSAKLTPQPSDKIQA